MDEFRHQRPHRVVESKAPTRETNWPTFSVSTAHPWHHWLPFLQSLRLTNLLLRICRNRRQLHARLCSQSFPVMFLVSVLRTSWSFCVTYPVLDWPQLCLDSSFLQSFLQSHRYRIVLSDNLDGGFELHHSNLSCCNLFVQILRTTSGCPEPFELCLSPASSQNLCQHFLLGLDPHHSSSLW